MKNDEGIVKTIAIILQQDYDEGKGIEPYDLEPGNCPVNDEEIIDGHLPNGEPGFYRWRSFTLLAIKIAKEFKLQEDLIQKTLWAIIKSNGGKLAAEEIYLQMVDSNNRIDSWKNETDYRTRFMAI